jgi:L-ascorbate metabolism protein UlaG (beta-lactamase superfamily)
MTITKFYHSCLLIEHLGKTVLIDPGEYILQEKIALSDHISSLDAIGITHEHADHMSPQVIKEILMKFPAVPIFSNTSVKEKLGQEGIVVETQGNEIMTLTTIGHERVFGLPNPPCPNTIFRILDTVLHVGDSLSFPNESARVLALPLQAPWEKGNITEATDKAIAVKPQYIVPIHDYHWKDAFRLGFYQRLGNFFANHNIQFIPLENLASIDIK